MQDSAIRNRRVKTGTVLINIAFAGSLLAGAAAGAETLSVRNAAEGCERRVSMELEGSGPAAFTDASVAEIVDEQRTRANCDAMRSLVVKGYAADRLVYQAIARAPRWSLRSTPILSGAEVIARATPKRADPARLPAIDGYSLSPVPERGSECAQRMYYNLAGQAPMTDDNRRYVDALVALAASAADACPELTSLTLQLPKNSGSRMSFFTVRKDQAWLPPALYAQVRDSHRQDYQDEHARLKSRPLPGPDTPNPLGARGYFASRELGRGIDFTLFEGWDAQRDYDDPGVLVIVHDARPADAAIVPLRFDPVSRQYQVGQVFVDEFNDVLKEAGRRLLNVANVRHYLAGVDGEEAKIVNASHAPTLQLPLFTVSYELQKTAIYTVPQAGLPRRLDVVLGVSPSGAMHSRGLFEDDARGEDRVLTLVEVEAGA